MKKLLLYEIKKIFSNKIVYAGLLVFLILSGIGTYYEINGYDSNTYKIPKELQKPATKELFENNKKIVNKNSDLKHDKQKYFLENYDKATEQEKRIDRINSALLYSYENNQNLKKKITKINDQINTNINNIVNQHSFEYRNLKLYQKKLKEIPDIQVADTTYFLKLIYYFNESGYLFLCILIILGVSTLITSEYSNNMDSILKSTEKGKNQIIKAKIYASIIYTVIIAVILILFKFIPYILILDKYGFSLPIQNYTIFSYSPSPYLFTLSSYLFIESLVHILGGIIFTLLVLIISANCRSLLTSIAVSTGLFALPIFIESFCRTRNIATELFDLSLFNIIKVEPLFLEYKTYNLFGYPILYPYFVIGIYILIVPIIIYFIYRFYNKKQVY